MQANYHMAQNSVEKLTNQGFRVGKILTSKKFENANVFIVLSS